VTVFTPIDTPPIPGSQVYKVDNDERTYAQLKTLKDNRIKAEDVIWDHMMAGNGGRGPALGTKKSTNDPGNSGGVNALGLSLPGWLTTFLLIFAGLVSAIGPGGINEVAAGEVGNGHRCSSFTCF
jgi:hypothetical protein